VCTPARTSIPSALVPSRIARGAADRACRAVERRHEAVARRVDLDAAEPLELVAHLRVMALEELAPAAVAERGPPRRADNVRDKDRREDAVGLGG
jgi:hypothetical protein